MTFPPAPRAFLLPLLGAAALVAWAFFPTFDWMVEKWINDPQYSHGFLVPAVSLFLLFRNLKPGDTLFPPATPAGGLTFIPRILGEIGRNAEQYLGKPWPVLGCVALVAAVGLRLVGGGLLFLQFDALAFLVSLAGLAMIAGGGRLLKMAAPAIAFLVFMVPLPYEIERNVGGPLKIVATEASVFLLQTLGYPAVPEGHVIHIDEVVLGVVDACSGLKMLMTFAAFAAGAVLLLDRTWFEKMLIVLGILPIAVITNVLRITATGVTYTLVSDKAVQTKAHDFYGWLMMPVGLGLLALQLWALGRLVVRAQAVAGTAFPLHAGGPRLDAPAAAPAPRFPYPVTTARV